MVFSLKALLRLALGFHIIWDLMSHSTSHSKKEVVLVNPKTIQPLYSGNIILELSSPYPSGIQVDHYFHNDKLHRIVRVEHSVIAIREQWVQPHIIEDIFPQEFCKNIIHEAESYAEKIGGWHKTQHVNWRTHTTVDAKIQDIFPLGHVFWTESQHLFETLLFPAFALAYGINSEKLSISDMFVTKYNSSITKGSYLNPHRDRSPWSFVITLNTDYDGGGTSFVGLEEVWKPMNIGSALIFHGKHLHGGLATTKGTRYILAGFCEYGDGNNSMEEFLQFYQPQYDGYAAQSGFRTGDIIRAVQTCHKGHSHTSDSQTKTSHTHANAYVSNEGDYSHHDSPHELSSEIKLCDTSSKSFVSTDDLDEDEWKIHASSCENNPPPNCNNVSMVIERLKSFY